MQCKILLCYPFPILSTRSSLSLFLLLLYYIPDSYTSSQFIWERHFLFLCCLYLSKHEIPCWSSCVFSVRTEWNGLIPKIQPPREGGEGKERERERDHLQIPAYAAVKALHACLIRLRREYIKNMQSSTCEMWAVQQIICCQESLSNAIPQHLQCPDSELRTAAPFNTS